VKSRGDGYNFLLALGDSFARNPQEEAIYGNEEIKPLSENLDELREGGVIVYDEGLLAASEIPDFEERVEENNWHVYSLDLRGLARDQGREVMRTAGVGATCAITGMDLDHVQDLMRDAMPEDPPRAEPRDPPDRLRPGPRGVRRGRLGRVGADRRTRRDAAAHAPSGSDAISYGAIDEGCRFIAGYPDDAVDRGVHHHDEEPAEARRDLRAGRRRDRGGRARGRRLARRRKGHVRLLRRRLRADVGAARARGDDGDSRRPVEAMRAGPSTGMPTKPEQSDLEHVLYTSQGDSQRVVLAPGTVEEAYEQSRIAFRLAYEYQIPSILLYDQKLGGELVNVPKSHFDREPNPTLGKTLSEDALADEPHSADGKFHRFQHDVEDGVSPVDPGQKGAAATSRPATNTPPPTISARTRTTASRRSTAGPRSWRRSEPTSTPRTPARTPVPTTLSTVSSRSAASRAPSRRRSAGSTTTEFR